MSAPRVPVVVWLSTFDAGGTERQMVSLMRGLADGPFEVHAACFFATGPWLAAAQAKVASVAAFPIHGFARLDTWRQTQRFAEWCQARQIRAVITSDFYTNVFGLTGARLAGVPVRIGGRREINTDKTAAKLVLQRLAYASAHRLVANSSAAGDRLRREGVAASRISVIPNGIDVDAFATPRHLRPVRRVVTVANLRGEKGHEVLLEAIARGGGALADLEFVLVGDGPCRVQLEAQARTLGIERRVSFAGERHDIEQLLADADLFVLPSRTEGLPNSVMEAMASGLPVVASRVGGLLELVDDGVTGRLVPGGDPDALAAAITGVAGNPAQAHAFGLAGRQRVRARYSTEATIAAFSALLTGELQRRAAGKQQDTAATVAAGH